jgi:hypothetical protein
MAKGGTIEIDVELQGTQNIETQFKNIGDASKGLASTMGNTNEKLGEGIDSLGEVEQCHSLDCSVLLLE